MAQIDEAYTDLLPTEDSTTALSSLDESGATAASTTEQGAYIPPNVNGTSSDVNGTTSIPRRRSSSLIPAADVKGVIFNLMNAVIGVGVLAMPYCFKRAGLLLAPILLLLVGSLTERSLVLMVRAGDILRDQENERESGGAATTTMGIGYSATVARCFGPSMGTVADVLIVTMNFGSGVAYLDVIADILAAWIGHSSKNVGLFLVVLFVVGPLSCVKAIESLKFTSLLGLCIYGAFALITVLLFFGGVNCGGTENAPAASIDLLVAIPIQTLAFACHTVVFPVYREFREVPGSKTEAFQGAVRTTVGLCCAMYVTVGFFGALTFKENTLGDVLKNYSAEGGGLAHFIEAIFLFSICMTYPLIIFPMRDSLEILVMKLQCVNEAARKNGWSSDTFNNLRFYFLTILILIFCYVVAVLIPNIEVVFGLTGCTFGIIICYILPCMMYIKASGERLGYGPWETGPENSSYYQDRRMAMFVLIVGSILGLASFFVTLVSVFSAEENGPEGDLCGNSTLNMLTPSSASL